MDDDLEVRNDLLCNLINWNWDDVIVISSDDEHDEEEETSIPINIGRKQVYCLVDENWSDEE